MDSDGAVVQLVAGDENRPRPTIDPAGMRTVPGEMSRTAAVIVDWTNGAELPASEGADHKVDGMIQCLTSGRSGCRPPRRFHPLSGRCSRWRRRWAGR